MSVEKHVICHPDLPKPYGAYSTAVQAGGFLFVSGLAGIVPETGQKAGEDFETQARQAFDNLGTCLKCAESSMSDVVRVVVYLTDAQHRDALNSLFGDCFPVDPPARSTPIVELPMGLLLSIEATAICRK
ncbi:endoribonuclease L-PSP [Loktanella atrilutea]|uniref:Endoribonuclease L-PSP n=1 Tax=Loktanella atrilutea TaxID=366533 RepID=A0A1M4TZD8_LOKAT|nr:Rid family hydrolase [Loktanella atrilutea]SHE49809.1 endoribonuclease L-PSP [Loktanella atrilutea]